jgi:hypothetical protein
VPRRRRWEPDSIVPELVERTAAERNRVSDEVREVERRLADKKRYLRKLEDTLKALKGTARRR